MTPVAHTPSKYPNLNLVELDEFSASLGVQAVMDYYVKHDVTFEEWFINLSKAKAVIEAAPDTRICLNYFKAENSALVSPSNECGTLFCNYGWLTRAPYFAAKGFGLWAGPEGEYIDENTKVYLPVDSRFPLNEDTDIHKVRDQWEHMVERTFGPTVVYTLFGAHPDGDTADTFDELLLTTGHKQMALDRYDMHYTVLVEAKKRLLKEQADLDRDDHED